MPMKTVSVHFAIYIYVEFKSMTEISTYILNTYRLCCVAIMSRDIGLPKRSHSYTDSQTLTHKTWTNNANSFGRH